MTEQRLKELAIKGLEITRDELIFEENELKSKLELLNDVSYDTSDHWSAVVEDMAAVASSKPATKPRRTMSVAARKRISQGMKRSYRRRMKVNQAKVHKLHRRK